MSQTHFKLVTFILPLLWGIQSYAQTSGVVYPRYDHSLITNSAAMRDVKFVEAGIFMTVLPDIGVQAATVGDFGLVQVGVMQSELENPVRRFAVAGKIKDFNMGVSSKWVNGARTIYDASFMYKIGGVRLAMSWRDLEREVQRIDFGVGYKFSNWLFEANIIKPPSIFGGVVWLFGAIGYKFGDFSLSGGYFKGGARRPPFDGFTGELSWMPFSLMALDVSYRPHAQMGDRGDLIVGTTFQF